MYFQVMILPSLRISYARNYEARRTMIHLNLETRYLDSPLDILLTFEIPETDVEKRINLEASKFVAAFRTAAYILNVPIRMLGLHLVVVRSRKSIFDSVMLLGLSR